VGEAVKVALSDCQWKVKASYAQMLTLILLVPNTRPKKEVHQHNGRHKNCDAILTFAPIGTSRTSPDSIFDGPDYIVPRRRKPPSFAPRRIAPRQPTRPTLPNDALARCAQLQQGPLKNIRGVRYD
jgi:hypothetical protein